MLLLGSRAASSYAESLLSVPRPDPLASLVAPETQPLTRKAQVLYPSPGLPSLVMPGDEIVVRIRVRRAMTPPPGIQQHHVLMGWNAKLQGYFAYAAKGTTGAVEIPLITYQIRPEDLGFVYRIRFKVPRYTTPGVYDLIFDGPGIHDQRQRSVRVIRSDAPKLDLAIVPKSSSLRTEAEALFLLAPTAVIVPGGLRESASVLSKWPLATIAVPSPDEVTACRSLHLSQKEATEIFSALGCNERREKTKNRHAARCVLDGLGGAKSLDDCGDELLTYVRRFGSPTWAVRLGDVSLLGLNTSDRAPWDRARLDIRLGHDIARFAPALASEDISLSEDQLHWLERELRFSKDLVLVSHHSLARWTPKNGFLYQALRNRKNVFISSTSAIWEETEFAGSSSIHLKRVEAPAARPPIQPSGLEPGRYRLSVVEPREPGVPAAILQLSSPRGIVLEIGHPPTKSFTLNFLVPVAAGGWRLIWNGRRARIVDVAPGNGDICEPTQLLLIVEVDSGLPVPTRIEVIPNENLPPLDIDFELTPEPYVLGRMTKFRARNQGAEISTVLWDFGDNTTARGHRVEHRYLRSGPTKVCAMVLDTEAGRMTLASWNLDVTRWRSRLNAGVHNTSLFFTAWGLIALATLCMLLGCLRGNIFARRSRLL